MQRKSYKPWSPLEPFLFPPSPSEWLPKDHLAWFVLELIEELDLGPFHDVYAGSDPRGEQPFDPSMMIALLLYAYATGVVSSRQIERSTHEDVAFRVLAGGHHPHFTTICRFRRTHAGHFEQLFLEVLRICREMEMVDLGRIAIDGTRLKANASKHRAMSYGHMQEVEVKLQEEIRRLLELAERTDQEEDALYGPDGRPYDLPAELSRRETRLTKIRAAKAALEEEARQARTAVLEENAARNEAKAADPEVGGAERKASRSRAVGARKAAAALGAESSDAEEDPTELPRHRQRHCADGTPHPRAQRSFTDPDSRIMAHQGGFLQGFNAQIVVSADGFIAANGLSNQAPDTYYMRPMLERLRRTGLGTPDVALADSGYWAPINARWAHDSGTKILIATGRKSYARPWEIPEPGGPPVARAAPSSPPRTKEEMGAAVSSVEGWGLYRHRKHQAETPFGIIKQTMRFRQTGHRGLAMVAGEWNLVCAAFDVKKLHRATRR